MMFISYEGESHSHSHSPKHKSLMYECATASSSQMLFHKYQVIVWCIVEYIKTSPNAIRVELNCTSREKKENQSESSRIKEAEYTVKYAVI